MNWNDYHIRSVRRNARKNPRKAKAVKKELSRDIAIFLKNGGEIKRQPKPSDWKKNEIRHDVYKPVW